MTSPTETNMNGKVLVTVSLASKASTVDAEILQVAQFVANERGQSGVSVIRWFCQTSPEFQAARDRLKQEESTK